MSTSRPSTRRALTALVVTVAVLAVSVGVVAQPTLALTDGCSGEDTRWPFLDSDAPRPYAHGFEDGTAQGWSGVTVLPIGADGSCSAGVERGDRATLDRVVTASNETVVGTLDVGSGGALELAANDSDARILLRNVEHPNDRSVALVVERNGTVETRRRLETHDGRFFDFRLRWLQNGTVRLTLGTVGARGPAGKRVDVATTATTPRYRVGLSGAAYLDRLAVVGRPESTAAGSDDGFDHDDGGIGGSEAGQDRGDGEGGGLVGPALLLVVFGAPGAFFPRETARFGEQVDAIGSTTDPDEVEPAEWNVTLTRFVGGGMVVVGCLLLVAGVF